MKWLLCCYTWSYCLELRLPNPNLEISRQCLRWQNLHLNKICLCKKLRQSHNLPWHLRALMWCCVPSPQSTRIMPPMDVELKYTANMYSKYKTRFMFILSAPLAFLSRQPASLLSTTSLQSSPVFSITARLDLGQWSFPRKSHALLCSRF